MVFRVNVGAVKKADGTYFKTGLPNGFSDIFGYRKEDGKVLFIEVKKKGGRISESQKRFLEVMKKNNALTAVVYSVEDTENFLEINKKEMKKMTCGKCGNLFSGELSGRSAGVNTKESKIIIRKWNSEMEERENIGEIEINYCPYCGERVKR